MNFDLFPQSSRATDLCPSRRTQNYLTQIQISGKISEFISYILCALKRNTLYLGSNLYEFARCQGQSVIVLPEGSGT